MKKNLLTLIILFAFTQIANAQNSWTQKDSMSVARYGATSFGIGNKGYIASGYDGNWYLIDFWEFDPSNNVWTQKADFNGYGRRNAVGFSIGTKGYIGTGINNLVGLFNDFWEYNPATNIWTQRANFPGVGREGAVGFSIGNKGYLGTGKSGFTNYHNDFWEYNPATNIWTQKAGLLGPLGKAFAAAFSIGTKGYVGTGYRHDGWDEYIYGDIQEFDPLANSWSIVSSIPVRHGAVGFSINNKGYIGMGERDNIWFTDLREYDPIANTWVLRAEFPGVWRIYTIGFSTADKGYIGTGYIGSANPETSDFWEYTPGCSPPSAAITTPGPTTFCTGGSVVLNGPTVTNRTYQWKKDGINIPGATSFSYTATISGNYKVTVTNTNTGCTKTTTNAIVVTVKVLPNAAITPQGPLTFCAGDSVVLQANTGAGLTYKWKKGGNYINGATLSAYTAIVGGTYKIEVTNSNGCSKTSVGVVVTVPCKEGEKLISDNQTNITIYPNPSHGEFVVAFDNSINIGIIQVYNSLDEKIFEDRIFSQSKKEIHLKNISSGIYFVKVFDGKNQFSKKLIID